MSFCSGGGFLFIFETGTQLGMVAHICNSSTFGRLRQVDHLKSGVRDQPGQHSKTPSLLRIQKLAEHDGTYSGKLPEPGEIGCSEP